MLYLLMVTFGVYNLKGEFMEEITDTQIVRITNINDAVIRQLMQETRSLMKLRVQKENSRSATRIYKTHAYTMTKLRPA